MRLFVYSSYLISFDYANTIYMSILITSGASFLNMFFLKDIQLFILITALQFIGYCTDKQNFCSTQHSVINVHGKFHDIIWKSKSNSYYSVVLSDPPCFDKNKNLAARVCSNSVWKTPEVDICRSLEENTLCPEGYIQEETTCTFLTAPQIFESYCPFFGASSKIKNRYNLVWLPIKRKIAYGPFEYIRPGENYGLDFLDEHSSEVTASDPGDKNCLIIINNNIQPALCNSSYVHVCSYKYNQFLYRCPQGCVSGGLRSSYCFCKVHGVSGKSIQRSNMCETLAVPTYSYERKILQKLVGDDTCWIGDLQENTSITQDYLKQHLYLAINKREWSIHKNGELNCAICKVPAISYDKVDLLLTFNSNSRKLYLNVYSPESIFSDDDEELVYCFTDATDNLKTRVETEGTWDSTSENLSGRRLKVFRVSIADDSPGYYWCEAFQLPHISLIKSNTVIAYKDFKGHEYSLRLIIYNFCRYSITQCKNPSASFITHISKKLFHSRFFSKFIKRIRLFHIYNIDKIKERADVLLHLTSHSKLPLVAEYFVVYRNLQWLKLQQTSIVFFRSSEVCMPENTLSEDTILHWKMSDIGMIKTPEEVCIQENGTPVKRKCQGDFRFGSQWGEVEGLCSQNITLSSKTEFLHSLVSSSEVTLNATKNISAFTQNSTDLTVLDLHYLAEALSKITILNKNNNAEYLNEISQIINNLMETNTTIMKLSQNLLNATDEILDTFENILLSTTANENIFLLKKSKLIIQITKPLLNNITGLVLYGGDSMSFLDLQIVPLYANSSFDSLLDDTHLQVAVYVPEKILNIISQNLTKGTESNFTIVTTVFFMDNFFNSDTNVSNSTVSSKVVSISIPGYDELLQTAIPIAFKAKNHHYEQECAYWNYGTSSETRSGYWSTLGGNYLGQLENTSLEVCSFTHLTNFALLVMSKEFSASDDASVSYNLQIQTNDKALTVISNIGCLLSLFGIFGIFITSVVFQSWREKIGTKILIQLCITILLQIIFLNMADVSSPKTESSLSYCITVGIILHYIIISEFCWMLVAAVLQFLRFVKVIGPMPNHVILKAMLVGWGLPLIPVVIVCIFDYKSYSAGIQGLCYPKGMSMYYGVLFPIGCIMCTNLAVFIAVIRNVLILKVEARRTSQTIIKQQICLAILLFFLLGLPWVFGLLAEIMNHDSVLSHILIYLFCFTATIQGFVLFLFYVVLDKSTRTLWYTLFRRLLNSKLC